MGLEAPSSQGEEKMRLGEAGDEREEEGAGLFRSRVVSAAEAMPPKMDQPEGGGFRSDPHEQQRSAWTKSLAADQFPPRFV